MSGGTMSDKGWVLAAIDRCGDLVYREEGTKALERLLAPKTSAADARELAYKLRETREDIGIIRYPESVLTLDEAVALVEAFAAARVEAALSEAADRAVKYAGSVYWYQSEYSQDCWDIDYDELRAAIVDGKK